MSEFARQATKTYADPLNLIWIRAAERYGLRITRTDDAYACYDGKGTLLIAKDAHLDADDSLAQMIFHELCHAAVAGPDAKAAFDWGLCNETDQDLVLEHACHRLQAWLSRRHGLRDFFAVTTDHRPHWDALPEDPLASAGTAAEHARRALMLLRATELGTILEEALSATRKIAEATRPFAADSSLWASLVPLQEMGFPQHEAPSLRCGSCAWSAPAAHEGKQLACAQTRAAGRKPRRIEADARACVRFEPRFEIDDCGHCGACCREGFHLVQVGKRERFARLHPQWLEIGHDATFVPRPGGRCVALTGHGRDDPYRCAAYEERPESCREFVIRGAACLDARRRVGLSH